MPLAWANKVWFSWALAGLAAAAFYKFAPSPEEDSYVKRLLAHYRIPKEVWEKVNLRHLTMEAEASQGTLLVASAQKPPVYRYRFPQCVVPPHFAYAVSNDFHVSDALSKSLRTCSLSECLPTSLTSWSRVYRTSVFS